MECKEHAVPDPLAVEPCYGAKVGRVWKVTKKTCCASGHTWYGDRSQKEALKRGLIYSTYEAALLAARLERARLNRRGEHVDE